jgi:hypothetical protein
MSHTLPSIPTKDDILILYSQYGKQAELQNIINDDQASNNAQFQAELHIYGERHVHKAPLANTPAPHQYHN